MSFDGLGRVQKRRGKGRPDVRFGSSADICRKKACPLYPRKRTCAVQWPMSAKGHPAPLFWLGEMLFQPRDLFPGPAPNIRHLDPCLNVVRRGVDVAVANRRCGCHELVRCQLKKSYDRVPPQSWRHVRATRRQHPVGFAIETAVLEEGHRVACILEIDDPHWPPCGIRSRSRAIALSVLVHEPHERSVAEPRKPGGRSGIATVG